LIILSLWEKVIAVHSIFFMWDFKTFKLTKTSALLKVKLTNNSFISFSVTKISFYLSSTKHSLKSLTGLKVSSLKRWWGKVRWTSLKAKNSQMFTGLFGTTSFRARFNKRWFQIVKKRDKTKLYTIQIILYLFWNSWPLHIDVREHIRLGYTVTLMIAGLIFNVNTNAGSYINDVTQINYTNEVLQPSF